MLLMTAFLSRFVYSHLLSSGESSRVATQRSSFVPPYYTYSSFSRFSFSADGNMYSSDTVPSDVDVDTSPVSLTSYSEGALGQLLGVLMSMVE